MAFVLRAWSTEPVSRSRWEHREVARDGVTISVRDNRRDAPTVVLLTGLGSSQQAWDRLTARLGDRYRIITFDHRGHGRSSAASSYSFDALLEDLHVVLEDGSASHPLLCGWSLGADLAVWYAAAHPRAVAGVIALDGAIPAEPLPSDDDRLRRQREAPVARLMRRLMAMLGAGVHLSTDELLALLQDTSRRRTEILQAYERLESPVSVALASRPTRAAPDPDRSLDLWRAGAQQLTEAHPAVDLTWLDSDHVIPLRRPDEVADLVDAMAAKTRKPRA